MKYKYYPGCSVKHTGKPYEKSMLAVLKKLEVSIEELENWNCCGATAYMSINEKSAVAMSARNFALMTSKDKDMVVSCSACYLVLNKSKKYMDEYPKLKKDVNNALNSVGYKSNDWNGRVRHILDVIVNDIGIDRIKSKSSVSLNGIRVLPYYGCQIVRPYSFFDDQYNPVSMDNLFKGLGADIGEWSLKTRCCSGSLIATVEEVGLRLSYILLREAKRKKADVILTLCPMCQFNLECYQDKISRKFGEDVRMPVMFFTQLLGVALGISKKELGIRDLLTNEPSIIAKGV